MITICLFCRRRKLDDGTWIEDDPLDRCSVRMLKSFRTALISHVTCPDCKAAGRRMDEQEREG